MKLIMEGLLPLLSETQISLLLRPITIVFLAVPAACFCEVK